MFLPVLDVYVDVDVSENIGSSTHLSSLMVWPRKQGNPVSNISVTKATTASMYGLQEKCIQEIISIYNRHTHTGSHTSHLTARYPRTHISMNHLKGVASILPPMIITISSVSLMSGSQPRFPPGELSNMKPKSEEHTHIRNTHDKHIRNTHNKHSWHDRHSW